MTAKIYRRLLIGLSFIICHLSFSVALTSCSNDYEPTYLEEVRVSQSYIGFAAEGSTTTIEVDATADWLITTVPEWVTVSPMSGSAGKTDVTFTTAQATATQEGTVILECGGAKQRINVIQMTKKAEAQLATCAQIAAGNEGATYRVRGVCATNPDNQYGNWNIQDETGQIYIYGTLDKKGGKGTHPISGANGWGFGVGDIVTVEGPMKNYNGTIELVDVTVISIEKSLIKLESLSTNDPLPAAGGEVTAFISCKGNGIGVVIPDDAKSWLSISGLSVGSVTFRAQPNTGDFRKTTVTFTTADDSGNEYTAQATISQEAKSDPNAAGSLNNPFTPAEANAFCMTLGEGKTTDSNYYVKGKIIAIEEKNQFGTQYGNCTFYMSADGTESSEQFYVFRTLYLGNKKYSDDSWVKPKAGDEVIICGKLMLYKDKEGNLVPETSANNSYIYSLNGKTE